MSLRARLTILYSSLVGGILLLFGLTVYQTISVILLQQVDQTLIASYRDVLVVYQQDPAGRIGLSNIDSPIASTNVMIQFWSRNGELRDSWPMWVNRALDPLHTQSEQPAFRNLYQGEVHIRVLTVPLMVNDYMIGTLQIGASLGVVDAAQRSLLSVLVIGVVAAMSLAAGAAWFTARQSLAPLQVMTDTALQITRADDLSRRIPIRGMSESDEIGQFVAAFNQTLGRLEQLFHVQRRFLTDVGHELRTPLTVIKGNVALMKRMGVQDEDVIDSLTAIESEADRLTRLSSELLLLSQAESGKLPLDHRMVELDSLIIEVFSQLKVTAKDQINLHLDEIDQAQVCGDRDRLKQVFVNLLSNAIQYTPRGGEVHVTMQKEERFVLVHIRDTGPGISKEDLPHIFERFYRGEKSRTRSKDSGGFGLGLSIAYWIVRNHGGEIEVQSEVGVGTRFTVRLLQKEGDCVSEINAAG